MISYIKTGDKITVFNPTTFVPHTLPASDELFDALQSDDWGAVEELIQKDKLDSATFESDRGTLRLVDGTLYLNGKPLDRVTFGYAAERLRELMDAGLPTKALVNFIARLHDNPSYRVRRDLLKFLEKGGLPLMDDGCFVAYKRVRNNFKDVFSGSIDNRPGRVVRVPREQVDDDPNQTCSYGLHVCSYKYLPHYAPGQKVVAVAVAPEDVVSIPTDYDNSKLRTCGYRVLHELKEADVRDVLRDHLVYNSDDEDDDEEEFEW